MQKTIIFGTDIHAVQATELAGKLVRDLEKELGDNCTILSLENRKKPEKAKNKWVIQKFFSSDILRKFIQAILLPLYLIILRFKSNKILSLWTLNGKYAGFALRFMKILRYEVFFMVLSSYDKDYSLLSICDKIICQSPKMQNFLQSDYGLRNTVLIYPWTNLEVFQPKKKIKKIIIPSVPYKIKDFEGRGMPKIIEFLKKSEIPATIIFRSKESADYFKKLSLKNVKLINKGLSDIELAKIMAESMIMPLIYSSNAPDMPLSAIEGMASGCIIICSDRMGISEIVVKNRCGIILKNSGSESLKNAVGYALKKQNIYSKNSRKTADDYFRAKKNISKILSLLR